MQRFSGVGSSKHDLRLPLRTAAPSLAYHDFYITTQAVQALDHLGLADAAKLSTQQAGQLGLRNSQNLGSLLLRQMAMANDVANLSG